MMPRGSILTPLVLLIASATVAAAATPIGEAKRVVPAVTSTGDSGNLTLSIGSNVFQDDLVKTGAAGRAGLQFLDQTELEVGPNSSAKLDRFVFNPDKTASEASISLAKGVFRFVSGGHNRPNTYTITTPHVTLGIRGTRFQVRVFPPPLDRTDVFVDEGTVEACSKHGGGCKALSPSLPSNAGTFTVRGFVRTFAFRNGNEVPGGNQTGALGATGGSGGLPPSRGSSSDPGNSGDNGIFGD